jgi:F-box/WD-40 domain protein MET30
MVASGSFDGSVKVFNLNSSQTIFVFAHVGPINSIKVLDQSNLACASNENAIRIWNLQRGSLFGSLLHDNDVLTLEIFDRFLLVSGSKDQTAVL